MRRGGVTLVADFAAKQAELRTMSASVWPGKPFPLGATVGRQRHELLALLRERRARRALPVRRRRRGDARRAHRAHRLELARLRPGDRPRPALRLPRPRPVRAGAGAPLQPRQAAHRPVRQGDRGADPLRRGAAPSRTCPNGSDDADLHIDESDDAAAIPKCDRRRRDASTGKATTGAGRACPGTRPSSTRCTSRASRSSTPRCAKICAAPTPGSRRSRRSRT